VKVNQFLLLYIVVSIVWWLSLKPSGRCAAVVRLPSQDEVYVKKALDIGVDAIMVPQVRSSAEARRIVQLCKYPPQGIRGVGLARAQGYGTTLKEYLNEANEKVGVIIQSEHIDAVNEIHTILSVKGIDAVFVGPFDLSGSIGKLGDISHPEVTDAIMRVVGACKEKGIASGIFAGTSEQAVRWSNEGVGLLAIGIDALLLINGAKALLQGFRE